MIEGIIAIIKFIWFYVGMILFGLPNYLYCSWADPRMTEIESKLRSIAVIRKRDKSLTRQELKYSLVLSLKMALLWLPMLYFWPTGKLYQWATENNDVIGNTV